MYLFKKLMYLIFCKVLFNVKYVNKNLEKNIGRCVVCPNHLCFGDPIFMFAVMKDIAIMGKAELFKNKFVAFLAKKFKIFPIKREEKDAKSVLHAVNVLKDKKAERLLVFPEGTRVGENEVVKGKIGAVYIALKAEVPILPVRIIKHNRKRKIFTRVTVIYGSPINLDMEKIKDKEYLHNVTDSMMDYIYSLEE